MVRRYLAGILALIFVVVVAVHAQATRDYAVSLQPPVFSDDGNNFYVDVVITNEGGDATTTAELVVRVLTGETVIYYSATINPLNAGESVTEQIEFVTGHFVPGSQHTIEAQVGIDAFELANTPIAENNIATVDVQIPDGSSSILDNPILSLDGDEIGILDYTFTRQEMLLGMVAFVVLVIVLWLMTVILRLVFSRPPRFAPWQPPYGWMPDYDQNSLEGRRQAWQYHAQNGLLLAAPSEGNLHPVKLLLSADGGNLQSWQISMMRLSQYDTYGRISRSQSIADKKWVKRLNNVVRKRRSLNDDKVQKMLHPVAKGLVKGFRKRIGRKNTFLPIAFDLRLSGKHGDVRILFELYQCRSQIWYRLDQWEPTMMIITPNLQENLTFTIHGKLGNESVREFYNRLQDDLVWLLMEMMRVEQPQQQPEELPHDSFHIPDTLSGMEPIRDESQPVPDSV